MLIVMSMMFPVVQLVVLGYAFGGNVKHLKVGSRRPGPRRACRARSASWRGAVASGSRTFDTLDYSDPGQAPSTDLRNGRINGVLTIPPDFSRRVLANESAADRADRGQHRQLRVGHARRGTCRKHDVGASTRPGPRPVRIRASATLDVVEVYPIRAVRAVSAAWIRS